VEYIPSLLFCIVVAHSTSHFSLLIYVLTFFLPCSTVYDMCTRPSPHNYASQLYQRHGEVIETYLTETVLVSLQRHQISIDDNNDNCHHGNNNMNRVAAAASMDLLQELKQRWINHQIMNEWLRKFFTYMDREYLKRASLPHLIEAGLRAFRRHIYLPCQAQITRAILQLIALEREQCEKIGSSSSDDGSSNSSTSNSGKNATVGLVKYIVDLYKTMSSLAPPTINNINNNNVNNNNNIRRNVVLRPTPVIPLYALDLEAPFLEATREYYARKRQEWTSNNNQHHGGNVLLSLPQYLVKVEHSLSEERNRIVEYDLHFSSTSQEAILNVVETELLENMELSLLEQACRVLFENEQSADLQGMFRLFLRLEHQNNNINNRNNNNNNVDDLLDEFARRLGGGNGVAGVGVDILQLNTPLPPPSTNGATATSMPTTQSGLQSIADIFQQYITDCGHETARWYEKQRQHGNMNNGNKNDYNAIFHFVRAIMDLHVKHLAVVRRDFVNHRYFQKAFDDAFYDIVNDKGLGSGGPLQDGGDDKKDNVITGDCCFAQCLATFCHGVLLQNGGRGEKLSNAQVHEYLDVAVQLFSFLVDKDLFILHYRDFLGQRLLQHQRRRTGRDLCETERVMIIKLQQVHGRGYVHLTFQMQGMLADLIVSENQEREFKQLMMQRQTQTQQPPPRQQTQQSVVSATTTAKAASRANHVTRIKSPPTCYFGVRVLSPAFWPKYTNVNATLPPSMSKSMQDFQEWYHESHPVRNVDFALTQGTATVRATFGKRCYDLYVSTLQAIVLESLSGGVERSFDDLARSLNLEPEILQPLLHSLSGGKHKILSRAPSSSTKKIVSTDVFTANIKFSSKLRKIRFPLQNSSSSLDSEKVLHENRSIAVELAIVRIMKARSTLSHDELFAQVVAQLSSLFFKPSRRLVNNRIESLIERQYIERADTAADGYNYYD
jgi:cullin 1